MKVKRMIGMAVMVSLSLSAAVYAGSGQESNVAIGYTETIAYGNTVPMYGGVTVSGYMHPDSDNDCYYQLTRDDAISDTVIKESMMSPGFDGIAFTVSNAATDDYYLTLNPDGPNYYGVMATGKAKN